MELILPGEKSKVIDLSLRAKVLSKVSWESMEKHMKLKKCRQPSRKEN